MIVTIPLNKDGWNPGDLIKQNSSDISFTIALYNNEIRDFSFYTPQQLLVLDNEDDPKIGDIVKYPYGIGKVIEHQGSYGTEVKCLRCTLERNPFNVVVGDESRFSDYDVFTIIASYPHIVGTLPISKETLQRWIDNSAPKEGSVEREHETIARASGFEKGFDYINTDDLGNLILDHPKKMTFTELLMNNKVDDTKYHVTSDIYQYVPNTDKPPIIPTDEELHVTAIKASEREENFPHDAFRGSTIGVDDEHTGQALRGAYIGGYTDGYKKALKDLGYEK
jgi:hypothetical protein